MAINRATVILLLSAALALAAQPALAQHGGRGAGDGGHSGAGHAVPRGGGGYHGGGAQARHPQAGTGGYYHGYHGGYYGGYYGHYPHYGYGGHYGYGYGYYPYYGSSFNFGLSFGWPSYYGGWYPYAYPSYGSYPGYYPPPSYGYGYGYDAPQGSPPGEGEGRRPGEGNGGRPYGSVRTCSALRANGREGDTGRVRLEVRPEDASVYVDDEFCGNAGEARFLTLPPGRHSIELVRPGFEVARREADVVTGQTVDVLVELQQRSRSY
jgi:PEGA domain-containing protein